jgi:hypothetical protein
MIAGEAESPYLGRLDAGAQDISDGYACLAGRRRPSLEALFSVGDDFTLIEHAGVLPASST